MLSRLVDLFQGSLAEVECQKVDGVECNGRDREDARSSRQFGSNTRGRSRKGYSQASIRSELVQRRCEGKRVMGPSQVEMMDVKTGGLK